MSRREIAEAALIGAVRRRGGVARATSLQRDGHSRSLIADMVGKGKLRRVRRVWVAVPDADAALEAAAHHGVTLSCITLARRRGLWVLDVDVPHVVADPHARGGKPAGVHVHWGSALVPRHPDALEDSLENALALVAACQPYDKALVIWESALQKGLVERGHLASLPLKESARDILAVAMPFSDSGLETLFLARLRWLNVRIIPQPWLLGHRTDFFIGRRLVIQIDGAHHVGAQRAEDIDHDAALLAAGYRVIRFSYWQTVDDWPAVQDRIAKAVALGLHN